jgi:hypothetical protein
MTTAQIISRLSRHLRRTLLQAYFLKLPPRPPGRNVPSSNCSVRSATSSLFKLRPFRFLALPIPIARNEQSRLSDGIIQDLEACSVTVRIIVVCLAVNSFSEILKRGFEGKAGRTNAYSEIHFAYIMNVLKKIAPSSHPNAKKLSL